MKEEEIKEHTLTKEQIENKEKLDSENEKFLLEKIK